MTDDQTKAIRFGNIYVPIITVGSVIVASMYLTWTISNERSEVYSRIIRVDDKIERVADTVDKFVNSFRQVVDNRVQQVNSDPYTGTNALLDCLQTQILNPGWICKYSLNADWKALIEKKP